MKISVVGGSNIDLYGHQKNTPNGAAAADSIPGVMSWHAGGVGRNIAENLGRILAADKAEHGMSIQLITALGDDHYAAMIKSGLTEAGVDWRHATTTHDAPSDMYMAIYDDGGHMVAAVNDMSLIDALGGDAIQTGLADHGGEDIIIFDGNVNDGAIKEIIDTAPESTLCVDGVSAQKVVKITPYLDRITVLKCNRLEAAALTGLPEAMLPFDHAKALRDCGVRDVVISDGGDGFLIGSDDGYEAIPADAPSDIINVSGTGDALMAGLIYGRAQGHDMMTAALFAHKLAAITLTHDGPVHPDIGLYAHDRI